jgi:predicted TPR repeat methyltransferase
MRSPKNRQRKRSARRSKTRRGRQKADVLARALDAHRAGQLLEAERLYLKVHQAGPPRRDVVHLLGLVSHGLGKTHRAIELLRWATELDPDVADGHNDLGNVLHESGRLEEAERAYRRAIESNPRHASAHNNLGIVLKDRGSLEEAMDSYRRALEVDPTCSDAYYNLGIALKQKGQFEGAADALERAIELAPQMTDARRVLCGVLRRAERFAELESAFDDWLERDPTNPVARHLKAALSGSQVPTRAPDEYVRSVFDQFAAHFDEDLAQLGYEVPQLIAAALAKTLGPAHRHLVILDAGCGTGLCGVPLRAFAARLEGVDLSPQMVKLAEQRNVYDRLEVAELTAFMGGREAAYDVIVSSDTLTYFGDLRPPLASACVALKAGGRLIFSLELGEEGSTQNGFQLQPNGRYHHSAPYVKQSVNDVGFRLDACETIVMRMEAGKEVQAILVQAKKRAGER